MYIFSFICAYGYVIFYPFIQNHINPGVFMFFHNGDFIVKQGF